MKFFKTYRFVYFLIFMVVVQVRVGRVSGGCGRRGARHACAQCWAPWVRPVTPPRDSAAAGQDTQGTSATSVQGVTHRNLVSSLIYQYCGCGSDRTVMWIRRSRRKRHEKFAQFWEKIVNYMSLRSYNQYTLSCRFITCRWGVIISTLFHVVSLHVVEEL